MEEQSPKVQILGCENLKEMKMFNGLDVLLELVRANIELGTSL